MKKILFALLLSITTSNIFAQSKLIKYFNQLPKEMQMDYKIVKKGNAYAVESDERYSQIIIDDANGFLEFDDSGTGGGSIKFQLAIFKKASGKEIVAVNYYSYGDVRENGTLKLYDASNGMQDVTAELISDITVFEYEATKDIGTELSEWLGDRGGYTYFELPRKGTTIMMHYGTPMLDAACDNDDKKACAFKKRFHVVPMYWRKEAGDNSFFSVSQ
jgi:hypothetical protein